MKTGRGRQARQGAHRWHSRPSAPHRHQGRVKRTRREGRDLLLVVEVVMLVVVMLVVVWIDGDNGSNIQWRRCRQGLTSKSKWVGEPD